jgi:Fe-S-cluster-containing hydrogenase component 2
MIRQVIKIDEDKCVGCGLCVNACHEGAIGMVDGKAKLLRDDYCDGLGNCLPACPTKAITFEEREAAEFDKAAVLENMAQKAAPEPVFEGCPGSRTVAFDREPETTAPVGQPAEINSQLRQWPVQIKLAPINAQYFDNANLLIAADCSAFAYGDFHNKFIKNHVVIIGCPKLDQGDYSEKLTAILQNNNIKSVKVVRMEVPCCGGLEYATIEALKNCGKMIPWQVVTISTEGKILD